ncbi:hypothetical protein P170DRAFT_433780 [Aspergillus steynii IBT 23096]|uniref:Membrane insertase YidC/Oxa/ALB C-terminal domain-containing protein n=1 Tax=Aspergillus steynii IBT 23096 TaxID=1392250 RepID=A0A2I2GG78_9EURO|nr:uncharacterized protein P170DRAFT_433780 [Aspergillus steynii IBT 23096]PLB51881.1 hypothetical protein P170DRAFT_433780 [Aspergillus steynii IBT 23096]
MSSFRAQTSGLPARYGGLNQSLAGNRSWRPASAIPTISSARFNSSSSTSANSAVDATPSANASDLSDLSVEGINAIPEKIGYLKDIGLDYGWGPTSLMEFVIEHVHVWSGLPWWASIVGTGLLIRLALLHPMLGAADTSTRLNNIKPLLDPLRTRMTQSMRDGNTAQAQQLRMEISQTQEQHGVKAWKSFVPLLQVPLGFGMYRVVHGMCALPVPELAQESFGWIRDLTVADPFYILPACSAFFLFLALKRGGETGTNQFSNSAAGKAVLFGLPAISLGFLSFFPSALQLYFATTGLFGLGQAYLLSSSAFRRAAGIAQAQPAMTPEQAASQQRKTIRMLADQLEASAKAANQAPPAVEASAIDRLIGSPKSYWKNFRKDIDEKLNSISGSAPPTNADGSPAEPPRLSEKDRQLAADYEKRRQEEETWKRDERNHSRRAAHLKALEVEREKARAAFKNASPKQR